MATPAEQPATDVESRRRRVEQDVGGDQRWRDGLLDGTQGPLLGSAVPTAHGTGWSERSAASRGLHRLGELSAHAAAGVVAAAAVLAWVVVGAVTGFPSWWQVTLFAASSSVTLVMVFAIQHTQSRAQSAMQRKLDELLRAGSGADEHLIAAEEASDDELEARAVLNLEDRARAR